MQRTLPSGPLTCLGALALVFSFGCRNVDYRTTAGPTSTACGGFNWVIQWKLTPPAPKPGFVVQNMIVDFDVEDCGGVDISPPDDTFWEGWAVAAGTVNDGHDTWNVPDFGPSRGQWSAEGRARYFPKVVAADFTPPPSPYSGILPSTRAQPKFWRFYHAWGSFSRIRNVQRSWNCCLQPREFVIAIQPETPVPMVEAFLPADTSEPPAQAQGDKAVASIIEIIRQVPPWSVVRFEAAEVETLVAAAGQLAQVEPALLERAIGILLADDPESQPLLDDMSRVYVLLRVLFVPPAAAPTSEVRFFGGWSHPSTHQDTFDVQWPVEAEGDVVVGVRPYLGFFGSAYDGLGEYRYFAQNYPRRPGLVPEPEPQPEPKPEA